MKGFLIRKFILPGCDRTSTLARGALSPRADSMSFNQSATSRWGWGLHTLPGGIDPGDICFLPRVVEVVDVWRDF